MNTVDFSQADLSQLEQALDMLAQYGAIAFVFILVALLATRIFWGIICHKLAARKGYRGYFFTGFFLGMIGLIYVNGLPDLLLRRYMRRSCKIQMKAAGFELRGEDEEE